MIAILVYFVLCALGVCALWYSLGKEKKNNDGIVKNKLDELYLLLEGLLIFRSIRKLSEPYVISIDDFAAKIVYLIGYNTYRKEYILFVYKPSDNPNNKAKDCETTLTTKSTNEILWYLTEKFNF